MYIADNLGLDHWDTQSDGTWTWGIAFDSYTPPSIPPLYNDGIPTTVHWTGSGGGDSTNLTSCYMSSSSITAVIENQQVHSFDTILTASSGMSTGNYTLNCVGSPGYLFTATIPVYQDWASYYGLNTDSHGNVLLTQDEFNQLVGQGFVAAAAGVLLIPGVGEVVGVVVGVTVVSVAILYIGQQAAIYIRDNLHPLATGPCSLVAQQNVPYVPPSPGRVIGSGTVQCIYSCRGYGAMVAMYCDTGKNCAASIPDGWLTPSRDCH